MPLQTHSTTTTKYYGFEGGGGERMRGEHKTHYVNTRPNPATASPLRHHASGARPLHPRDRDSDIREYLELINTTSNLEDHSLQPAYASKLGLAMPRGNTLPPPHPAGQRTSSTLAHVGGPRRQVVAPADFTLTPYLKFLRHYPPTPRPAPDTTDKSASWPGSAWRGTEEEGEENVLTQDFNAKFCRVVEDLLLSLARGGSTNSTWPPPPPPPQENLQTAAGQLQASFPREMKQKPDNNKASGTTTTTSVDAVPHAPLTPSTTTTSSAYTTARLLLLHMDGSPAKGALLPTLPYKGKINDSYCFPFFPVIDVSTACH